MTIQKKMIYESFKPEDSFIIDLEKLPSKDKMRFYDSKNQKTILRFY